LGLSAISYQLSAIKVVRGFLKLGNEWRTKTLVGFKRELKTTSERAVLNKKAGNDDMPELREFDSQELFLVSQP